MFLFLKKRKEKMGTGDSYQFLLYHMTVVLGASWLYIHFYGIIRAGKLVEDRVLFSSSS